MSRVTRVPNGDADIYAALAQLFRSGAIYAFSYEGGLWTTWSTEADWLATERNGRVRDEQARRQGHGPIDRDAAHQRQRLGLDAKPARKMTKAQLVAQLRAVPDLPAAAREILEAAA